MQDYQSKLDSHRAFGNQLVCLQFFCRGGFLLIQQKQESQQGTQTNSSVKVHWYSHTFWDSLENFASVWDHLSWNMKQSDKLLLSFGFSSCQPPISISLLKHEHFFPAKEICLCQSHEQTLYVLLWSRVAGRHLHVSYKRHRATKPESQKLRFLVLRLYKS